MKRFIITAFIALLLVTSCGNGQSIKSSAPATPSPLQDAVPANTKDASPSLGTSRDVIIDTDMAVDDWMAILFLLHRKDVNVRAITVTGSGEAHCDAGVQNALGLINLAQHLPIPVACGPETPLQGDHAFPQDWRDFVDGLAGQALTQSVNPGEGTDAVKLLTQTLLSSPEKTSVLILGPLTNVALALQATPTLTDQIAGITVMGGAVEVAGNLGEIVPGNTTAEWNIYIDPQAANIVFASGLPITLVSLDATNHAPLTLDFFRQLEKNQETNATKFIHSVLSQMQDSIRSGTYYFWDPLSAAILADKDLATYRQYPICVVETEGKQSGRTEVKDGCPQLNVAVSVDAKRFEEVFLDTLNN